MSFRFICYFISFTQQPHAGDSIIILLLYFNITLNTFLDLNFQYPRAFLIIFFLPQDFSGNKNKITDLVLKDIFPYVYLSRENKVKKGEGKCLAFSVIS